jgi:hypothetical protein
MDLVITKIRIPCKYKNYLPLKVHIKPEALIIAIQIGCFAPGYQKFINMQFFVDQILTIGGT